MVHYLAATSRGTGDEYSPDFEFPDCPISEVEDRIEYAAPEQVHWKAKKEHVIKKEQGYQLNPETLPKHIVWKCGAKPVRDILPWFIVSPRFRDLVEQFEPGVHQFVPIDVHKKRNGPSVATYYWFVVCQRLDSVDREHTTFKWEENGDHLDSDGGFWTDSILNVETMKFARIVDAKLVFSNDLSIKRHIWVDPRLLTGGAKLCSDAFAKAALSADFSGLGMTPRETVQENRGEA